ncbi:SMC-Scp complex subunit ScpB [Arthrobacter sp. H20]|uniref:SMC-Scp complex subunit ScpB n=1 Tax=Arthrobacter sp. H20 TaxID=1267981 RepID=UPI000478A3E7|nr:SMC-Scp complex subunit ScpB [Arthrobacter sp. H20]
MKDQEPAAAETVFDASGEPGGIKAALEAVLMVVDEPITDMQLATALLVPVGEVQRLLVELQQEYDGYTGQGPEGHTTDPAFSQPRGFELRSVAGGWRIFSRSTFAPVVAKFVLEGQSARLSQAALETLAVIAYRQPVSRARVSGIRGVNVDSVVRTLALRGLIAEEATDPETGAILYGTTSYFLQRLGIGSVADLPQLSPHLPGLENLGDFDDTTY